VVRSVHIFPGTRDYITPNLEFDIEMYVGSVIDRYKKFQIILFHECDRFYAVSIDACTDVWTGLYARMSNSLLTEAISAADMM